MENNPKSIQLYTCMFFFQIIFHYWLLQDTEYSSFCYIVDPCCLFIYSIVFWFIPNS